MNSLLPWFPPRVDASAQAYAFSDDPAVFVVLPGPRRKC